MSGFWRRLLGLAPHATAPQRHDAAADPEAIARDLVDELRSGKFASAAQRFAPPLASAVPVSVLEASWKGEQAKVGAIAHAGAPSREAMPGGLTRLRVPLLGDAGTLTVILSVDGAGRVQGLRLETTAQHSWSTPDYANPATFDERDIALHAESLTVGATLSVPRTAAPHPGVVLLSGGGPFDRDETTGPNKPLKDLAWGLASRGIAVLRFDRVSHTHADYVARSPGFTMSDDYVPHALEGIRQLQSWPGVDPARVYVVGHSMGGKIAPRVAQHAPTIAGLVILAGDTQPMHVAAVRVARYLASLAPPRLDASAVAMIERQSARVADPSLSAVSPASELLFGYSGAYWLDVRGYDPVATAQRLSCPMLILQGGRDYQVTIEDDLGGWQRGLAGRENVTIRVFPADDHLFFAGEGESTPADYQVPRHVDEEVVEVVGAWVSRTIKA